MLQHCHYLSRAKIIRHSRHGIKIWWRNGCWCSHEERNSWSMSWYSSEFWDQSTCCVSSLAPSWKWKAWSRGQKIWSIKCIHKLQSQTCLELALRTTFVILLSNSTLPLQFLSTSNQVAFIFICRFGTFNSPYSPGVQVVSRSCCWHTHQLQWFTSMSNCTVKLEQTSSGCRRRVVQHPWLGYILGNGRVFYVVYLWSPLPQGQPTLLLHSTRWLQYRLQPLNIDRVSPVQILQWH